MSRAPAASPTATAASEPVATEPRAANAGTSEQAVPTASPEAIVDIWITRFVYLEFSEDGTFNSRYSLDEDPIDYGTYTFDGRSLSITTEGGASECEAGETAHYQVTFSEDATKMVFSQPDDPCSGREVDLESPHGMTRYEPDDQG